jgi:predicted metal-dependent enzyme (double-stranded beta helix superfamily)
VTPDLAGQDAPVRALLTRIAAPAAAAVPDLAAIGGALADLAADRGYLDRWIEQLHGAAGTIPIHVPERGPRLMLVHRPQGELSTIHDHGTWVVLAPIVGLETHRRWRVDRSDPAARPELVETRGLRASDVMTLMPPDDVHDHGHLAGHGVPAHILVMTGDDQTRFVRHEWDVATGRRRDLPVGQGGRFLATEPIPG